MLGHRENLELKWIIIHCLVSVYGIYKPEGTVVESRVHALLKMMSLPNRDNGLKGHAIPVMFHALM